MTDKEKFIEKFWIHFKALRNYNKEKLLNYWFENYVKNFWDEAFSFSINFLHLPIDYYRFAKTFWMNFTNLTKRQRNKLLDYWFEKYIENFQNDLPKNAINFLNDLEWYWEHKNYWKFVNYFWETFSNLKKSNRDKLCKYWFEKYIKVFWEEKLLIWVQYLDDFNWYLEYKEYLKFHQKYWSKFYILKNNVKKDLSKYWFDNYQRDFWDEELFIWHKFLNDLQWYFYYKEDKKLLKEFWRNYFKLLPENKEIILKKYWFEKTKDKLKELKYFAVLLYEFHLWEELKVEDWEVVCEKCWNKYKINKSFLKKIRESGTHCIECKILNNKKFSKWEKELLDFIRENFHWKILENNRTVLDWLELDIYLKELNCWIEYNGNYHHRNQKINLKQKRCEEKDINFILVWEDLWLSKREIVKKEVLRKLKIWNKIENTENFSVKEITKQKAKEFLNKNHLYWFEEETDFHLWLFDNWKLISVISIKNNWNSSFTI